MKVANLEAAMDEAQIFIIKAEAARKRLAYDKTAYITGCKETGAARRASLDLTRALAKMRQEP